jgi:NADH:ubiquinone oxidoreductase subunit 4 (subunit M)
MFIMITALGSANRKQAAIKFLMYEIFAGAALLIAILLIFSQLHTLDIGQLKYGMQTLSWQSQLLILIALGIAFMINMPLFPFHLWLPDAHAEASTEGSMVLSGILTKFGAYGLLLTFRLVPIAAKYSTYIAALAIFSSFYSVFVMMKEKDMKRIMAYTTVVDMGIIGLAIGAQNAIATEGAVFGMVAHGITIALMFLIVGSLHEIFGERDIRFIKNIATTAKTEMYLFIYGTFATIGAPLTAAFISEIMIFTGAYTALGAYSLIGLAPIALMAGYLYYVIQGLTSKSQEPSKLIDISLLPRKVGYGVLVLAISLFGILPFILLKVIAG